MKSRASRGHTHDPWPCCGSDAGEYGRPKGGICLACTALIKEGRAARQRLADEGLAVYKWTTAHYIDARFPGFDESHDRLTRAFFDLVNTITHPAPADTPRENPEKWRMGRWSDGTRRREYEPWPWLVLGKGEWSWHTLVLAKPSDVERLRTLHAAILSALDAMYHEGKHRGSSALLSLASGEVGLQEFEQATLRKAAR